MKKCKLAEFGECQREFTPLKEWAEFCCDSHRKRWHYLDHGQAAAREAYRETYRDAVEDAENGHVNGHAHVNGHDGAKPKLTLAALGLAPAQPITQPQFKRRKLNTQNAGERA